MDYVTVYITAKTLKEARNIAKALVRERLLGCANIIPETESVYWWGDKMEEGKEVIIIGKTKGMLAEKIVKRVKELHSYSTPCITFLPLVAGNADYFLWLEKEIV